MSSKQIFICHTDTDKDAAQSIAISLRGRGYRAFLDRDTLPPGASYDQRIEKAIKQSSAFVFLISPQSVQEGRYTLTELRFAANKWPNPSKVVLPVLVAPTDTTKIPAYLKGVTIFEPHGNLSAEVSAQIASMVPGRSYFKVAAVAVAIAALLVIGIIVMSASAPVHHETAAPQRSETFHAFAQCRINNKTVHGRGQASSKDDAIDNAISDCVDNGGTEDCCHITSGF